MAIGDDETAFVPDSPFVFGDKRLAALECHPVEPEDEAGIKRSENSRRYEEHGTLSSELDIRIGARNPRY